MARYVLGVGHDSAATLAALTALVADALAERGLSAADIACVASIEQKAAAGLVAALADELGRPARYFSAAVLEAETPRLLNPSEAVFRQMGCHGVAEAAALAAAGPAATLILPKTGGKGVTCAIARAG
jgi:cobalamin biosynthesis protein CbiG